MTIEHKKDQATKSTGRRYSSVDELLRAEGIAPEVQSKMSEIEAATTVVEQLSLLRQMAGLTQEQMAPLLGFNTQSAVSKLECGLDDEVTIGQIRKYVEVSGERVGVLFGKPFNHVEAVKAHAFGIKKHLSSLATLAHKGDDLKTEIEAFFGEAFFNILTILSQCQAEMPEEKPTEVRLEVLGKPSSATRHINRPSVQRAQAQPVA
jgi:transcriptional regulator with XRE-family HTH domain